MRLSRKPIAVLFFLFINCPSFTQPFTHSDTTRGQLNRLRSCYDVTFYDLNLKFDLSQIKISGSNKICYNIEEDFDKIQVDLFADMEIQSIVQKGNLLPFTREGNAIYIQFASKQKKGKGDSITIYYSGSPHIAVNPPWDGGIIWTKDSLERPWVAIACEAIGASLWWPCKDHLSDEPDSMRMSFTVPEGLTCISNGNLTGSKKGFGVSTYNWMVNYPINNYNVSFYIGYYSHFNDTYKNKKGETLALDYYVLDYNLPKAKKHFEQVKPMLQCYENLFGPYPFYKDGYALVEAPYWGMEHQGAIAYGNHFKSDMTGFDFIIIHESAHEWWGNSLSVADHGEMWIHEAFATYSEALLIERSYDYSTSLRYLADQKQRIINREPMLGPLEVNYHGWKDADMYYKGTWMLHTLRNVIDNDSLWFSILHGLTTDFRLSTVNSEMIINYISKKSGVDLHYFFDQYLKYPKPPHFVYEIKKQGRKNLLLYKWETEVIDFKMPYRIQINKSEPIQLNPTTSFQTLTWPRKIKMLNFPKDFFYVDIEEK